MGLVLIFCVGWVASHVLSEKTDEYSAAQEKHRDKYLAKLRRDHPSWGRARQEKYLRNAARRNTVGHFAYLLRHGWSSTFNDVWAGWKHAKAAHEEWRSEHPSAEGKSPWKAFMAGIKNRWSRRGKRSAETADAPKGTPALPTNTDVPTDDPLFYMKPSRSDADVYPLHARRGDTPPTPGRTAGSMNGSTPMEAPNLDAARAALAAKANSYLTDAAGSEQLTADMMAGGMGADNDTMGHIAAMNEALATAAAHANAANSGLSKHSSGQEYANSGHAANTDYLKSS